MDEQRILLLSKLEHDRDAKRLAIEQNFEERTVVRQELLELQRRQDRLSDEKFKLEQELQQLDEQILNLEHVIEGDHTGQDHTNTHYALNDKVDADVALADACDDPQPQIEVKITVASPTKPKPKRTPGSPIQAQTVDESGDRTHGSSSIPRDSLQQLSQIRRDQNQQHYPWTQKVHHLLKHTFKISAFRDHQEQVINATLSQQDVFCIMRTGGGKSLTYQLPSILEGRGPSKKITVVVSPLLSLIQDQEDQLNQFCRNSALSFTSANTSDQSQQWANVRDSNAGVCLILVTPERVSKSSHLMRELQQLYSQGRLGRFVIDEAHCATQWGHDFRPDYVQLGRLKQAFPMIPLLALTATASDPVRQDVCQILGLRPNHLFLRSSANRSNLHYSVRCKPDQKDKVIEQMADFIKDKHPKNAGIIYTFSRKEADYVAKQLGAYKITAAPYHSSVSAATKSKIHTSWMRNKTQVVVATIAFGLGINKPDVRFVLHHSISKTLEAYYQESGRAGRDGEPADCVLWYSPKDVPKMLGMISGTCAERSSFWPMTRYGQAHGNDAVCRAILMAKLGEPNSPDPAEVHRLNEGFTTTCRDVSEHVRTLLKLMQAKANEKLTLSMLVKEWRSKPAALQCLVDNPPQKDLRPDECERIIVMLLVEEILNPRVVSNKYSNCVYIEMGPNVPKMVASKELRVPLHLPKLEASPSAAKPLVVTKKKPTPISKRRKKATAPSGPEAKRPVAKRKLRENSSRRANGVSKKPHLIDLADSDSSDELSVTETAVFPRVVPKQTADPVWDGSDSDDEEEYEYDS